MYSRIVALSGALLFCTGALSASPDPPRASDLALGARRLRAVRIPTGYQLTGQALVKDTCTAARFARFFGTIFPPAFDLLQYRRPGTIGRLCGTHPMWVVVQPLPVTSEFPPRYVTVRTRKGPARVPIVSGSVSSRSTP